MLAEKNNYINEVCKELDKIRMIKGKREAYTRRQIAIYDFNTQKNTYINEGKIEKSIEMAKRMLIKNKPIEEIIEFTDLTYEQIKNLKIDI